MSQIYERSHKRIFDFLYKYTQNADTAMDLMQDSFLSFHKHYGNAGLSEEKSVMVLYTIARNLSINYAKKFSTSREIASDEIEFHSHNPKLETKAEYQDLEDRLYSFLGELSEDERSALLLKNVEGFQLVQIAEILGVSVSTASRLVIKATEKVLAIAKRENLVPD
ncbi:MULTISPECIES: RNA polymerase sigma factor [Leptospira]|uniref:RNA polymerase sigma factor n=4 Tax=Leptospira TaxID=171 RepID=A0A4Z1A1C3_9LEPT|nr:MULTISPECIES: RNA polymerase sigma factor [Leptospira]MBL0955492.1 RNA polymerase sigma factor [Leptospira sp.]MCW7505909.1 RNA polymerase sigma factor [Leptospira paudalimensis]TGL20823.1 RNA polymerase sigma factor [Leptospira yanagawae]TGL62643.1 RNA polymerase sigma factor [Leptospira jelokensis]TGM06420.1 RNA polymerase sigma factor [Leptospira jelokensis]